MPMEIDTIEPRIYPKKLTDSERQRLMKIGGCFKCRKIGHLANDPSCEFNRKINNISNSKNRKRPPKP